MTTTRQRQTYSVVLADAGRMLVMLSAEPLTISELAGKMQMNRTKVHRWCRSLTDSGLLVETRSPNGKGTGAPARKFGINPALVSAAALREAKTQLLEKMLA